MENKRQEPPTEGRSGIKISDRNLGILRYLRRLGECGTQLRNILFGKNEKNIPSNRPPPEVNNVPQKSTPTVKLTHDPRINRTLPNFNSKFDPSRVIRGRCPQSISRNIHCRNNYRQPKMMPPVFCNNRFRFGHVGSTARQFLPWQAQYCNQNSLARAALHTELHTEPQRLDSGISNSVYSNHPIQKSVDLKSNDKSFSSADDITQHRNSNGAVSSNGTNDNVLKHSRTVDEVEPGAFKNLETQTTSSVVDKSSKDSVGQHSKVTGDRNVRPSSRRKRSNEQVQEPDKKKSNKNFAVPSNPEKTSPLDVEQKSPQCCIEEVCESVLTDEFLSLLDPINDGQLVNGVLKCNDEVVLDQKHNRLFDDSTQTITIETMETVYEDDTQSPPRRSHRHGGGKDYELISENVIYLAMKNNDLPPEITSEPKQKEKLEKQKQSTSEEKIKKPKKRKRCSWSTKKKKPKRKKAGSGDAENQNQAVSSTASKSLESNSNVQHTHATGNENLILLSDCCLGQRQEQGSQVSFCNTIETSQKP